MFFPPRCLPHPGSFPPAEKSSHLLEAKGRFAWDAAQMQNSYFNWGHFFYPGVRDGMCFWAQEQIYVCNYGRGTLSCVALGQYVHCKPRDTRECPTRSMMPIWLGQAPTPEHRSDCFRIRYVSKVSITTWVSPLCQGSCDSISQNEDNKLFVKGKKNQPRTFLCIIVCSVSESQNWVIVWDLQI